MIAVKIILLPVTEHEKFVQLCTPLPRRIHSTFLTIRPSSEGPMVFKNFFLDELYIRLNDTAVEPVNQT